MHISLPEAQKIALHSQLLTWLPKARSVEEIMCRLGYIQIDMISVIERSHHRVLFTRNNQYSKIDLDIAVANHTIFECWSHAAAYLPMADYQYSLFQKQEYWNGKPHWYNVDAKTKQFVYDTIKNEGRKMSRNFEHSKTSKSDWDEPKPIKMALNQLFIEGLLFISGRKGFQKIFDLTERCLPSHIYNQPVPDSDDFTRYLIERSVASHGLARKKERICLRKGMNKSIKKITDEMLENKELIEVTIEGFLNNYYTNRKSIEQIDTIKFNHEVHFLSPFDNLIIQRQRAKDIFGLEYQLECYLPKEKRAYGYFVLPILFAGMFVGRMDCKAERKLKQFYVLKRWFKKGFVPDEIFVRNFRIKLQALAKSNECFKIVIEKVYPSKYKKSIACQPA